MSRTLVCSQGVAVPWEVTGTEQILSDHRLQGNQALSQPPYTLPAWLRTSSPQGGRPLTHR